MKLVYLTLPLLVACTETVESTDVRTTGVYPEITAIADGSGSTEVTVRLKVGGNNSNTFLDLESPDTLEVTAGDDTRSMEQRGNDYTVTFPVDDAGTEFTIAFLRNGDGDAPESVAMLPEPFDLSVDDAEATRPDGEIDYTWDPAGTGDMRWGLAGACIYDASGTTPDDGANSVRGGDIDARGTREDEDCTVTLSLERRDSGTLDSAFTEGGEIYASHVRTGTFVSRPPL